MGLKRAVSPLIATILLVALTVSIGAMIIGFGKTYVEKQTRCLGYGLEILGGSIDTGANVIRLEVSNTGTKEVMLSQEASPLYFRAVIGGQTYYCEVKDPATIGANECAIKKETSDFPPGTVPRTIELHFGSGINIQQFQEGEFYIKGCGRISNTITIYDLT